MQRSARIRVLQIITALEPGGAERLLLQLTAGLDKDRFETRLISLRPQLGAIEAYGFAGPEVTVFDLGRQRWRNLRGLARYIEDFRPDVVHAHMFHALIGALSAKALTACRPEICFTSHNNVHRPIRKVVMRSLRRMRSADIIFQPDQHPLINAPRVVVIANGVPVHPKPTARRCWSTNRQVRMLAGGSLTEQKDPMGMLTGFLEADIPHATLEFAGAGPLGSELRSAIKAARATDRIIVHGFRRDLRTLMRETDCFVMHSKWEGMPMALLEAGAEAMPVVATPVGSIPAVLGADRGILATPEAFPNALRRIAADAQGALAMGVRLREHIAAHYSIESTVRAHEQLYEELDHHVR